MDLTELNALLADPASTTAAMAQKWAPGLLQDPNWCNNAPLEAVMAACAMACFIGRRLLTPEQAMSASMSLRFRPRLSTEDGLRVQWMSDLLFRKYGSSN